MGNRGALTRGGEVRRPWQVRRWIACRLSYQGWRAPAFGTDGRWTPLFFLDEAVALAAGHRPCALCRRADFDRWKAGWETAVGSWAGVDAADRVLHDDRVDGRTQRTHTRPWTSVPVGAFVRLVDGRPARVDADRLRPWTPTPAGYGRPVDRPARGLATVLTPRSAVEVIGAGYTPSG